MKTDKRLEVLVVREAEVKKQKRPIGLFCFVGVTGFEPATPCTPCKYATGLRHTPINKTA